MSDNPMGPGWAQAPNGKWYPPQGPPPQAQPGPPPGSYPQSGPPPGYPPQPGPPPGYGQPGPPKKGVNKVMVSLLACGGLFLLFVGIVAVTPKKATDTAATTATSAPTTTGAPTTTAAPGAPTTPAPAPAPTEAPTTTAAPDPAALETEFNLEALRACQASKASGKAEDVRWDKKYEAIGKDLNTLRTLAQKCLDDARAADKAAADAQAAADAKAAAERELASAQTPNVDAIVKNPDKFKGQTFVFVVDITQYDAATGSCAFRGLWDTSYHQYNFDYKGDNAIFSSGDASKDCPVLDNIDENDIVKVWAKSTGSFSYDTQIGGNTTVPSFNVLKAELLQKG